MMIDTVVGATLVFAVGALVTVAAIGLVLVWLSWGRQWPETNNERMRKVLGKGKGK